MTDVHPVAVRSKNMRAIKARDTRPEIIVRRSLHGLGFRYRLYNRSLPGSPDIVLKKYRAIIQVQGCFWHGHDCHLFKLPQTRQDFWLEKINANRTRDQKSIKALLEVGWRVAVVWECALKGKTRHDFSKILSIWIKDGQSNTLTISGNRTAAEYTPR